MVFGTFDLLHEGHLHLFKEAKKYGDFLIAVVARDVSVKKIKGFIPHQNELQRLEKVHACPLINKALLGYEDDFYKVIEQNKPDVLCFGYDQDKMNIKEELRKRKIKAEVTTLSAFQPEKYKSSLARKNVKMD